MPKSEREETLSALTTRIFSALLDELILDATLQSHHEVARGRAVCPVCNTQCGSVHVSGSSAGASQSGVGASATSRSDTPSSSGEHKTSATANGSAGTGSSTPTSVKVDGTAFLDCVSCGRQIASNRYAPHLSNCMGLSSSRRGAVRGNPKSKPASDPGRSPSPDSDGNISDERSHNAKGKGKAKGKRGADESDFSLKRKRPTSPQSSPNKKSKKGKASGSPVSRVKANPDLGMPSNSHYSPTTKSQSKIPSKLRDSSTASFLDRSSASSRSSSPEGVYVATPASSLSAQSPHLATTAIGTGGNSRGRPLGTGPPRRPSPPRPLAIHPSHFGLDVEEGEETGSSTDTSDSS